MAAVTVTTSTHTSPLQWSSQRRVDRCQDGVLWMSDYSGTAHRFWYSTDDGATWTEDSAAAITPTSGTAAVLDLFIDLDNYVHIAWQDTSSATTGMLYRRGTLNAAHTAITWSSSSITNLSGRASLVAFRKPGGGDGWYVALFGEDSTGTEAKMQTLGITSSGTFDSSWTSRNTESTGAGTTMAPCLDFNHTGDGKTVANNAAHLYAAWSTGDTGSGKGIRFRKYVWTGSTWSINTPRDIATASHADGTSGYLSAAFDGAQFVMAWRPSTGTTTVSWAERDAGDTTTTTRTPTALADGAVQSISVSFDSAQNGYILAVGATSLDPKWVQLTRSALTWGSWTTVEAATTLASSCSLQRGYSSRFIRAVWATGAASPYNVRYEAEIDVSIAPSASTWASPSDGQAADVAETLTLDWTFVDVDSGDSQTAYAMRRQIGAAAYAYWNAGSSTWGAGETKNTSATTSLTLTAAWGTDAEANHKYAVKTWDEADLAGTYSDELTVIPSAKDNPTISDPADAGTFSGPLLTVTWSATTQTAYKAELLNTGATTVHESSGWVTSTDTSYTFTYVMTNSTGYKVRITTKNDEGLTSAADTNSFTASFTPPATPTLVVTGGTPTGAIRIAITNGAGPPTTTSVDLYRREGTDSSTSIRIATGLGSSPTYDDYAVESGTAYQYQAIGSAATGASATSAWTA